MYNAKRTRQLFRKERLSSAIHTPVILLAMHMGHCNLLSPASSTDLFMVRRRYSPCFEVNIASSQLPSNLIMNRSGSSEPLNENVFGDSSEMSQTAVSKRKAVVSDTFYYNSTTNTNRSQ